MRLGRCRWAAPGTVAALNDETLLTMLSSAFIQRSQNRVSNLAIRKSARERDLARLLAISPAANRGKKWVGGPSGMPSGMSALTSSVSRSLDAPVSQPARAVPPRRFPDLGSVIVQRLHVTPPVDLLCGVSLASRTPHLAAGSLQISPPSVRGDSHSRDDSRFCSLGHGDTSMPVLGIG